MIKPDPKPGPHKKRKRKLSRSLVAEVFERDSYQCQYCFEMFLPDQHTLDCALHAHHIKHVSQGGKDVAENLKTCCWKCHSDHGMVTRMDAERSNNNRRKK